MPVAKLYLELGMVCYKNAFASIRLRLAMPLIKMIQLPIHALLYIRTTSEEALFDNQHTLYKLLRY